MRPALAFYWAVASATVAVFGAMTLWAAPRISDGAGGRLLFDERFSYTHAEAAAFVGALTDEARALYMIELRLLDTLFPILLAISLAGGILLLTRGWAAAARAAAVAPAILGAAFDLTENAAVAAMLRAGEAGLTQEMVVEASFWTSVKWIADLSAAAILVAILYLSMARRIFGRSGTE